MRIWTHFVSFVSAVTRKKFSFSASFALRTHISISFYIFHYSGYAKYVLLGELNYGNDTDDAQPQQFDIIDHIRHPDFKYPSKYNDIALIRINGLVKFNQYIRPACLPQTHLVGTEHVIASGWGKTNYNKPSSQLLQKVILEIFPYDECNVSYATDISRKLHLGIVDETQLCAGSHTLQKDTCQVRFMFQF